MSLSELQELLESTEIPVTYQSWPEGKAPEMPYICYQTPETNNFFADGKVFFSATSVTIDLYTRYVDPLTEVKLTNALDAAGCGWNRQEDHDKAENCFIISYEIEVKK